MSARSGRAVQPGSTDLLTELPAAGEQRHPYEVHTHYFGFSVAEAGIGAYVYLRAQPGLRLAQGGVSLFRGMDNVSLLDVDHLDYRTTMPWPEVAGSEIRVANGLVIDLVEPGRVIGLRYRSPDGATSFDLVQEAVTPLVARGHVVPGEEDHHAAADEPGGSEQYLHCTGELVLRGERLTVDCHAVRDRSWRQVRTEEPGGARPMPPIGWTPMWFGPDLIVNTTSFEHPDTDPAWTGLYDLPEGTPTAHHAWLVRHGELRDIVDVRRRVVAYHPTMYAAVRQELDLVDDTGERYHFEGEALSMAAMYSWPNIAFHDSVYRWVDAEGRTSHGTYQEIWWDRYQLALKARGVPR